MNLQSPDPTTLQATGLQELSGSVAPTVRDTLRAALTEDHRLLEVDLADLTFIDSSGLGALIALHKTMAARGGKLRLVNPSRSSRQILELTRLQQILEIVVR